MHQTLDQEQRAWHQVGMQLSHFDKAVMKICEENPRIERDAYYFLQDALGYASEKAQEESGADHHVSATELLLGLKDYALTQFGPMAATLFNEWNLCSCNDIGDMVFHLIDEGIFSKQDSDKREDFTNIFEFNEAFIHPFLPNSQLLNHKLKQN